MNAINIKSTLVATLCIATATLPFSVNADTFVYSGKGAFGYMGGNNGGLSISGNVFENVQKNKSEKNSASGAWVSASFYTAGACWSGYGETEDIEFKATGNIPKHVIASGAVEMSWYDWCGSNPSFIETLEFNMDLTALTDQAYSGRGMYQEDYGVIKFIYHTNYSSAPAEVGAGSYFSSPTIGEVAGSYGEVGQSKDHQVEIVRDN